jgi:hypothetical protein
MENTFNIPKFCKNPRYTPEHSMFTHNVFLKKVNFLCHVEKDKRNVSGKIFWSTQNCHFTLGTKIYFSRETLHVTIKYLYIHMNIFLKFLEILKYVF